MSCLKKGRLKQHNQTRISASFYSLVLVCFVAPVLPGYASPVVAPAADLTELSDDEAPKFQSHFKNGQKLTDSEIADDLMRKGSALVDKKKYREAIRLYDQITKLHIKTTDMGYALYKRGVAYQHLGAHEEALADLERAEAMGIRAKHINRYLGECYVQMAMFDKAIVRITAAMREITAEDLKGSSNKTRTPSSERLAGLYVHRAAAYKGKGNSAQQLQDLTSAIKVSQRTTRYYKERAVFYAAHGELGKAVEDYTQSLATEPGNANTLNDRAHCLLKLKRYKEAAADWTKAIAIDPHKAGYYASRAQAYEGDGQKLLAAADRKTVNEIGEDFEIKIWNKTPAKAKKKPLSVENP